MFTLIFPTYDNYLWSEVEKFRMPIFKVDIPCFSEDWDNIFFYLSIFFKDNLRQ